jgi:hypothetical protein
MWPFQNHSETGKRGEPLPAKHDGPPDSARPSGLCPRCGKQSSFDVLGSVPLTFDGGMMHHREGTVTPTHHEQSSVLVCRHCKQGVSVLEEVWVGETRKLGSYQPSGAISWRGFHWWPLPDHQSHEAIPPEIAEAFNEALRALTANCPRASAVMLRRTLEAIVSDKGYTTGTLADRFKKMADAGILQPVLAEWAKEVRLIGNVGAHFDPIKPVSIEDSTQLTKFIQELLNYLYIMPDDLRKAREGRRPSNRD